MPPRLPDRGQDRASLVIRRDGHTDNKPAIDVVQHGEAVADQGTVAPAHLPARLFESVAHRVGPPVHFPVLPLLNPKEDVMPRSAERNAWRRDVQQVFGAGAGGDLG